MEKPSSNMEKRVARLRTVQALFQMEASGADIDQVTEDLSDGTLFEHEDESSMASVDMTLFQMLMDAAISNQKLIDQATDEALVDRWPLERVDPTLRALFRSACAELVLGTIPYKVTINEFVEVAKAFYPDGPSHKLVNAVLQTLSERLRPS